LELAINEGDVHIPPSLQRFRRAKRQVVCDQSEGLGDLEDGRLNLELNNQPRVEYGERSCTFEIVDDGQWARKIYSARMVTPEYNFDGSARHTGRASVLIEQG